MSVKELSEYTRIAKYARHLEDEKRRETWNEQVARVFDMHREKYKDILQDNEDFNELIEYSEKMVLKKRVLGSQRALQFGGKPILKKNERLYNCSAMYVDRHRTFQEAMYLLLCGCGVGFSIQKHHVNKLPKIKLPTKDFKEYQIPDTIEGWADACGVIMSAYFDTDKTQFSEYRGHKVRFDYSKIRPKGSPLSSGSKAPGPDGLRESLVKVNNLLKKCCKTQSKLKPIDAYDILMHFSNAVLSGGVRRSATICLFSPDDKEMATAKTGNWFETHPQRARSNNSVMLVRDETTKETFKELMENVKEFGEPGFVWADDVEALFNPCCEIGLYAYDEKGNSGVSFCVSGDTKLITKNGIERIQDTIDKEITIWNGNKWKRVSPFQTGRNQKMYRVFMDDGSYLDCTGYHKFLIKNRFEKEYREVDTLEIINILTDEKYKIHVPHSNVQYEDVGISEENAYDYGYIIGDGSVTARRIKDGELSFDKPKTNLFVNDTALPLNVKLFPEQTNIYETSYIPATFECVDREFSFQLKYDDGLPRRIFSWNRESIKRFVAGWIDSDGCSQGRGFRIYGREDKIRDLQLLLTKINIRSSVNLMQKKGTKTNLGIRKNDVWYVQVSETKDLYSERIELKSQPRKQNGKGTNQTIKCIFELEGRHDSYCLTEEENHTCLFNNIITKQCNLCEINMKKTPTEADFYDACKAAAILGTLQAGYTSFPYLGEVTENIVKREALLGVSMTGMMDTPEIAFNPKIQKQGARIIKAVNEKVAKIIGINAAARLTCVKPSGTSSCILGTSSGIHPHHSSRYIRRVQANKIESPIQHFIKTNPMAVEQSVWKDEDYIISFVCEVAAGAKVKNNLSAIEMLENVKLTQMNWVKAGTVKDRCLKPWSIHNVSNTITVNEDEWKEVTDYIYKNKSYFSGISLLPSSGDLDFPQAPFVSVLLEREIISKYGEGSLFSSGLIEYALVLFNKNLWKACDFLLGFNCDVLEDESMIAFKSKCESFCNKYLDGDIRKLTYLLKDVYNRKLFLDLQREYKKVDWTEMVEDEDNVDFGSISSCAGGHCELGTLGDSMKEKLNKNTL